MRAAKKGADDPRGETVRFQVDAGVGGDDEGVKLNVAMFSLELIQPQLQSLR